MTPNESDITPATAKRRGLDGFSVGEIELDLDFHPATMLKEACRSALHSAMRGARITYDKAGTPSGFCLAVGYNAVNYAAGFAVGFLASSDATPAGRVNDGHTIATGWTFFGPGIYALGAAGILNLTRCFKSVYPGAAITKSTHDE